MKKFGLLCCCLVLFSCSNRMEVEIPDEVLSMQKMSEVMVDVHLMEASMSINGHNPAKMNGANPNIQLNIDILKKHNITKKQYEESFNFYTNHPAVLAEVYQLVLNHLSQLQAEVTHQK